MLRIIHSRYIPFGNYAAINLFGFIIIRRGNRLRWADLNHELIHSRQQAEMLWIPFYIWYVVEWLVRLIAYRDTTKAYYNISFEREAYANQYDIKYLRKRNFFSWMRYLRKNRRSL